MFYFVLCVVFWLPVSMANVFIWFYTTFWMGEKMDTAVIYLGSAVIPAFRIAITPMFLIFLMVTLGFQ